MATGTAVVTCWSGGSKQQQVGSRIPGWLPAREQALQSSSKNVRRRLQWSARDTVVHEFYQWSHEHHRHINPVRRYPGGNRFTYAFTRFPRFEQAIAFSARKENWREGRSHPEMMFPLRCIRWTSLTECAPCGHIDYCSESEYTGTTSLTVFQNEKAFKAGVHVGIRARQRNGT